MPVTRIRPLIRMRTRLGRAGLPAVVLAVAAASSPLVARAAGPVFVNQAFAYQPGGVASTSGQLPTEETYVTGAGNAEGNIAVSGSGAVFVNPGTSGGIVRSADHGQTWTGVQPPASTPACAGAGTDHTIWDDQTTGRLFTAGSSSPHVNFSDDGGTTWSATCGAQSSTALPSINADRASIFGGPPSPTAPTQPSATYPDMVYYCGQSVPGNNEPGTTQTVCEHSYDGGVTWTNAASSVFTETLPTCLPSNTFGGQWTPDIAVGSVGPDGTLYIAKPFCGEPYLAMSHDHGDTWTRVQIAANGTVGGQYGGYESAAVADKSGNVYYMWIATDDHPYLAVSHDHGSSWGAPMMVAAPGVNTAFWPNLAIDNAGHVAMLYMGTSSTGYADASEAWFGYLAVIENPTDPQPVIEAAPSTPPGHPLLVGAAGPDRAPTTCGCDYVGIATGPDGAVWALFYDNHGTGSLNALAARLFFPSAPTDVPEAPLIMLLPATALAAWSIRRVREGRNRRVREE
jgi:hypothetical protein